MTFAFTFPGQGSQTVGMGQSLAQGFTVSRHVFEEVDEALGDHLSRIMWEGPEATLTLTANAQPALMAVSLAAYAALRQEYGADTIKPAFMAGHSLGEYSALAAAGVFSVAEAAKLLRLARTGDAGSGPARAGGYAGTARRRDRAGRASRRRCSRGRSLAGRERQRAGTGRYQRDEVRDGTRRETCARTRHPPRSVAASQRTLPLRAR